MKKKSVKIKKQRIIGKETYIKQDTGEIKEVVVVEKNVEQDFNFYKVWLLDLLGILDIVGNKKIKVINYLLEIMNPRDNSISITYKEVEKHTGVSYPIVVETFKILLESNFLVKVRQSFYMINPDIIVKGSTGKRINLLIQYKNLENENNGED